jgi:hypothetical protein
MKITWTDGLKRIPNVGPARQVPVDLPHWSSSIWITEDGQPWRRQINPATMEVTWKPIMATMRLDTGQFGVTTPGFRSILNMVALAWRHRKGKGKPYLLDPNEGVHSDNVRWKDEDDDPETGTFTNERWDDLEIQGVVAAPKGYRISNRGRLYSPYTRQVTRGFYHNGHRYAGLRNGLLVDLTVASGQIPDIIALPDYLANALNAFEDGIPPWEHAYSNGIKEATVWGYYIKVAPYIDQPSVARQFIDEEVWEALLALPEDILMGPLKAVRESVEYALEREVETNELVLARGCLIREL